MESWKKECNANTQPTHVHSPNFSTFNGSSGHNASSWSMCGGTVPVVTRNDVFLLFFDEAIFAPMPMVLDEGDCDLLSAVFIATESVVASLSLVELTLSGSLALPPPAKRLRALEDVNRFRYVELILVSREAPSVPWPLTEAMMFDKDCSSAANAFSSLVALAWMMQSSHHARAISSESHMCTALDSAAVSSLPSSALLSCSSTMPSNLLS